MACTTILVGRKASYDGSTMIARNDDSGSGHFTPKKFVVVPPQEHPAVYRSVLSHVEVELPGSPMRMTAMPNAVEGKGIWAAGGVNEAGVGMTATETITSNPRVLGADPLVEYIPAKDGQPEVPGGIGEEDIVYLVLPYIHTAREGVLRLGKLLEKYGTYEMNGIAFQDVHEIWWLETIGGHHWIAKRVPDDAYVVMPNQLGIDQFVDENLNNDEIQRVMQNIEVIVDPQLDKEYTEKPDRWAVELTIACKDGKTYTKFVEYPKGDPPNPMTWDETVEKFMDLSVPVYGEEVCKKLVNLVATLDEHDNFKKALAECF